jgi:hypothetical protein
MNQCICTKNIPVHGNVVHQSRNTCLESEASWQESNRAMKLGRYEFHPGIVSGSSATGVDVLTLERAMLFS